MKVKFRRWMISVCLIAWVPFSSQAERGSQEASRSSVASARSGQPPLKDPFHQAVDEFSDHNFRFHPSLATSLGIHTWDDQLEDYSLESIHAEEKELARFEAKFQKFSPTKLNPEDALDRELLLSKIRAALLELKETRSWQRNPDYYSSGVTQSIFSIMSRKFAPADERLSRVIARENAVPRVFAAARKNLKNPPKIYTEIALEQLPGLLDFFKRDVPAAFSEVKSEKLLSQFNKSNQLVIAELQAYQQYLKKTVLPQSKGEFRLGVALFRKKLLFEEMVDDTLQNLLKRGYSNLRENQKQFAEIAKKLDPKSTPEQTLAKIMKDHPTGPKLLEKFRSVLEGMKQFLIDRKIVTLPSLVLPKVEETPAFMRALTMASMDTPGPFEAQATDAYFNVTLPEAGWSPERIEEHLQGFSRGVLEAVALHEAYPGHYTQFLWLPKVKSKVRKIFGSGANSEGWAHYVEQMMLDEGYGNGDPNLRLGQLQDALLRNARYIVAIEMHTGKMSYNQAIDFFVKEGYQSRANAERETKRGTADPLYLVYTLGKLQIYDLRAEYKKLKGDRFSLQEFHDEFLKQGFPPIRLVRQAILK